VQDSPTQGNEEVPIWERRERERKLKESEGAKDLPFGLYLLFSAFTAIASVRMMPLIVVEQ
jgi:hypothetical protein